MLPLPAAHHSCGCSCPSELLSTVLLSPPWQEWMDEVRSLLAFLETDREADESDSDRDHAVRALQAVYGEGAENRTYDDLVKAKPAITIPHSRVIDLKTAEVRTWQLSRAAHPSSRCSCSPSAAQTSSEAPSALSRCWGRCLQRKVVACTQLLAASLPGIACGCAICWGPWGCQMSASPWFLYGFIGLTAFIC